MAKQKVSVLNIEIDSVLERELLETLVSGVVFTPNVDHLVNLQRDSEFYDAYSIASWVLCDSRIVSYAAKFLGSPIEQVIPGSSFFQKYYLFNRTNADVRIFLLGAVEGVAHRAMSTINAKVRRRIVVGAHSPSFQFAEDPVETKSIVDRINQTDATVLVVGVGSPKQEKWIFKNKDKFHNIKLFMALGATIDFEAGSLQRAPMFLQLLGLEWLFRLCKEPKRLWRRYLIKDMSFFYYIILQKIGRYKNPFLR